MKPEFMTNYLSRIKGKGNSRTYNKDFPLKSVLNTKLTQVLKGREELSLRWHQLIQFADYFLFKELKRATAVMTTDLINAPSFLYPLSVCVSSFLKKTRVFLFLCMNC